MADCLRVVKSARTESPENRLEQGKIQFLAKSNPIATKFEPHGHKAMGELSLRDHRSN
jgi:hypothetical protein